MLMKEIKDILDDIALKQNPYSVREGYFDFMESRVNDRIDHPASTNRVWNVAKPAILLACSFLIIFGIGYGTLSLTNTLGSGRTERNELAEESFDSFLQKLYNSDIDTFNADGSISDEEVYKFMSEYYSPQYVECIFASAQ